MVISLLFFDIYYILMQMNRQWMYGDRRTSEYITGLQNFIVVANANRGLTMVLCAVCVFTVRTRKTTQIPEPFTPTCFDLVSCPAIIVGPSTEFILDMCDGPSRTRTT